MNINHLISEPQPPLNLQATSISTTIATITWSTPPTRATPWGTVFNYEIILTEHRFGLPMLTANTVVESFTFVGLEEFNNYSVVVAAENRIGRSDFSTRFYFLTLQAGKQNKNDLKTTIIIHFSLDSFSTNCCSSESQCCASDSYTYLHDVVTTTTNSYQWNHRSLRNKSDRSVHWKSVQSPLRKCKYSPWTTSSLLCLLMPDSCIHCRLGSIWTTILSSSRRSTLVQIPIHLYLT